MKTIKIKFRVRRHSKISENPMELKKIPVRVMGWPLYLPMKYMIYNQSISVLGEMLQMFKSIIFIILQFLDKCYISLVFKKSNHTLNL